MTQPKLCTLTRKQGETSECCNVKHTLLLNKYSELYCREKLDEYLSRALNVPLIDGRLTPIDEQNYVLTLDFTLKMLNIHERYECGVPVIIEGETGVGKTALIEMLSKLWNHSWIAQWELNKDRILDIIKKKLGGMYQLTHMPQEFVVFLSVISMTLIDFEAL